jgi:hypothetical protein
MLGVIDATEAGLLAAREGGGPLLFVGVREGGRKQEDEEGKPAAHRSNQGRGRSDCQ